MHHSHEWGVAAGALPDRPIVKTERAALPVGRVAPDGAKGETTTTLRRGVVVVSFAFLAIGLTEMNG